MNQAVERVLGIEIAEDKIKILEICVSPNGLEVLWLDKIDLLPGSLKEGVIIEPKLVAETLSLFLKENKISTKKVIALINPPYVSTRIIRLPYNLSDNQIRLNLEAELQSYRIFAGKDNIIDFKKLEEISEAGIKKVNVLFSATSRILSESYLRTMELASLDLIGIDVSMLSILRSLDEVDLAPSSLEVTLLILVSQKYLEICILKGNRPRFLHSIEIDMYDFQKDKINFIDKFVSAIKLVVNFYQARFMQGEEIARIVVNPLDAKYSQIHALLQEKLPQIPIQITRSFNKVYINQEKLQNLDALKFEFSGLLGATLRIENKNQPFNLNLLLEQKTLRQYRLNQTYLLLFSLTSIFSAMIILLVWVVLKINILQRKIYNLNAQINQPSATLSKAMGIKEKKDIFTKQIDESSIIARNTEPPFYFKNIAKTAVLVPQDLWLTDVSLEEPNEYLFITGEAKTEKPIFDYIAALTASNYFTNVELVSSKGELDTIKFNLRCKIK